MKCNISKISDNSITSFDRETGFSDLVPTCVRFRTIIYMLSLELFDKSFDLPDFPVRKHIRAIGFSDEACYSSLLSSKFSYSNTFWPDVDIQKIQIHNEFDFAIASDVFEHVQPPVSNAFSNLFNCIKPGGFVIFSVPFVTDRPDTSEWYPNLFDYSVIESNSPSSCSPSGQFLLHNTTKDGKPEFFLDPVFHGGPGQAIEMRVFALQHLKSVISDSGFVIEHIFDQDVPELGIFWTNSPNSRIMLLRKPA